MGEPLRIPPPPPPPTARALHLVPAPETAPPPPAPSSPQPETRPPSGRQPDASQPVAPESSPLPAAPGATPERLATRRLERELAEMQEEVEALQEMLQELPAIFERTFRGRMEKILRQQAQLEGDNQVLRQRLLAIAPGAELEPPALRPRGLLPASVRRPVVAEAEALSDGELTTGGWEAPTHR